MNANTSTNSFNVGKRTYFFNIKQTKKGASYLNINISRKDEAGTYKHKGINVFENEMQDFSTSLMRSIINFQKTGRAAHIAETRKTHANAYMPWTEKEDQELEIHFADEKDLTELAEILKRKESAIHRRIVKLRLEEKYIL